MTPTRIRRAGAITLAMLFIAGLSAPGLAWLTGWDRPVPTFEKRRLAPPPRWDWTPSKRRAFPSAFEAYFNDRFGFRLRLIEWHNLLCVRWLNVSPSSYVLLGKQDWMFFKSVASADEHPLNDYRGSHPLSRHRLEKWRWMLEDERDWLAQQGAKFLFVVVPEKPEIYPEFLPDDVQRVGPEEPRQQLAHYLEAHSDLRLLDLGPALRAAKSREPVFWKKDTHWNDFGAYVGYREIMGRLQRWFPALEPMPEGRFTRRERDARVEDLAMFLQINRYVTERYLAMDLKERRATGPGPYEALALHVTSETDDPDLPRAVVFGDSFGEGLRLYLSEHFRTVEYRSEQEGIDADLVTRVRPDVVIQELTERTLRGGLRYPASIQREMAAARFDAATQVIARDDRPTEGPGPINLSKIEDAARYLPILRLDVTAPAPGRAILRWARREGPTPDTLPQSMSIPLKSGRNVAYASLLDPALTGELELDLPHASEPYKVHAVEIRGVPRRIQSIDEASDPRPVAAP